MGEKSSEHQQSTNNKDKPRRILSGVATVILGLAILIGGYAFRNVSNVMTIYKVFFPEPSITYNFAKYNGEGTDIYYGELINDSSTHAKDVSLKGKFNSEVIDFDLATSDIVEKEEKNNPVGSIEFVLKRLSRESKCSFSIIVNQEAKVTEQFKASWGDKGTFALEPQKADKNIEKGIELSDLSRKTRQKWLEDNTKNIRK